MLVVLGTVGQVVGHSVVVDGQDFPQAINTKGTPLKTNIASISTSATLAVLLMTLACSDAHADQPFFMALGTSPGGYSRATGVSADGSVVVGWQGYADTINFTDAFRWTRNGGKVALGLSSSTQTGYRFVYPSAVSADGAVIVGQRELWNTFGVVEAFAWTETGGMLGLGDLPDLPGGNASFWSEAHDVSADGSVIVGKGNGSFGGAAEAFRWTSATGMVSLGDLPGDLFKSDATAVSADGSVVVGYGYSSNGGKEAFRWTSAEGMVGLGNLAGWTIPTGNAILSNAYAVSADGSVVVGISRSVLTTEFEAFRWTNAGGMVGLGDLPGGSFRSGAVDVSADGSVVIGHSNTGSFNEPFIWRASEGMRNLRSMLTVDLGLDLSGLTALNVEALSADGRTIVGWATNALGSIEPWVAYLGLTEPFPGDANGDDVVDFTDLGILLNNYNLAGSFSTGDFDNTGIVDFTDLGILLNNYNLHAPALTPAAPVPEPSTLALAAFGALCLLIAARRRR